MLSIIDLFRIGIGPSSSHTVGPMRIARRFVEDLRGAGVLEDLARVQVELQGSLALTGAGHGTVKAVVLGLAGLEPETVDPTSADRLVAEVAQTRTIVCAGQRLSFDPATDIVFAYDAVGMLHPNAMCMRAWNEEATLLAEGMFYSIGGGFVADALEFQRQRACEDRQEVGQGGRYPFASAAELLSLCERNGLSIAELVLANEGSYRSRSNTLDRLNDIAEAMDACIDRGLATEGILPGGLKVKRRAPQIWAKINGQSLANEQESLFDRLNVYALAVNEENAAGGRVVTAPTNGAAGILPAVLRQYCRSRENVFAFLLTAGGIGLLYKQRASISGAEMGCQGEVGVASSMAAGGLAAVWGGTPSQVAAAAEIAMEHNLGLTCDPVGGLVQIPCIERNAIGAVKAVNAARLALHSDGDTRVTLDQVIETMRQTGLDMSSKYKETSQGGLAVNVVEC